MTLLGVFLQAKNECLALLCTPAAARLLAPAIPRAFPRAMSSTP